MDAAITRLPSGKSSIEAEKIYIVVKTVVVISEKKGSLLEVDFCFFYLAATCRARCHHLFDRLCCPCCPGFLCKCGVECLIMRMAKCTGTAYLTLMLLYPVVLSTAHAAHSIYPRIRLSHKGKKISSRAAL